MKLIVGLGNPGTKYLLTRHNVGFMVLDALAQGSSFQSKHKSLIQKIQSSQASILIVKPQTYMNCSGEAVQEIINFYKIPLENILIVQDDKDQNFLSLKFQTSRGHGGHNGIKDIHQKLGTQNYARLKLGIANASIKINKENEEDKDFKIPTSDFVLSNFNKEEQKNLPSFLQKAIEAVSLFITEGLEEASQQFNKKV